MTEKELQDILTDHADGLNRGEELSEALLSQHHQESDELATLLYLASALKSALTPVTNAAFKERLGHELVSYGPPVVVLGRSISKRRARAWLAVAAAGSVISVAGVTALIVRRLRSVKDVTSHPAVA